MIWLTWRQFRAQAAAVYALLALLAAVLVIAGRPLVGSGREPTGTESAPGQPASLTRQVRSCESRLPRAGWGGSFVGSRRGRASARQSGKGV